MARTFELLFEMFVSQYNLYKDLYNKEYKKAY